MKSRCALLPASIALATLAVGCTGGVGLSGGGGMTGGSDSALVDSVANKAIDIAGAVGGAGGFGGTAMTGFLSHCEPRMGFYQRGDLATSNGVVPVRLFNGSDAPCTFRLAYVASYLGLDEQSLEVAVPAGEQLTVDVPCGEVIGFGSLEQPGAVGCWLGDDESVDNRMAVPAFLGLDYGCGSDVPYACSLQADVDDLDGDGDTEEYILLSEAMQAHLLDDGPFGHRHGSGAGMRGPHMGFHHMGPFRP